MSQSPRGSTVAPSGFLAGRKADTPDRAPRSPTTLAPTMMAGNGAEKKKIATKAAIARPSMARLRRARLDSRTSACSTIASTAAFRPKNNAATTPTSPQTA